MGGYKRIPKEIKDQILSRVKNDGVSAAQAAADAGISKKTIYTWLATSTDKPNSFSEIARLKRENQGLYEVIGKLTVELTGFKKNKGPWS